jgi:ribosomal protein L17
VNDPILCLVRKDSNPDLCFLSFLFIRIFEIAPGAQDAFSFGIDYQTGSEEMYKCELFQTHATGLFQMVDAVVALVKLGQTHKLAETLVDLGKRHHQFGVRAIHYPIVGKALIHTLKTALGEEYTSEVHQGWTQVYAVIFTGMQEGAFYEECSTDQ